jgi:hypothetical protein
VDIGGCSLLFEIEIVERPSLLRCWKIYDILRIYALKADLVNVLSMAISAFTICCPEIIMLIKKDQISKRQS